MQSAECQSATLFSICASVFISHNVGLSVHMSVGPSVGHAVEKYTKGDFSCVTAPAHPDATDAVVYTALLLFKCHISSFLDALGESFRTFVYPTVISYFDNMVRRKDT